MDLSEDDAVCNHILCSDQISCQFTQTESFSSKCNQDSQKVITITKEVQLFIDETSWQWLPRDEQEATKNWVKHWANEELLTVNYHQDDHGWIEDWAALIMKKGVRFINKKDSSNSLFNDEEGLLPYGHSSHYPSSMYPYVQWSPL